MVYIRSLWHYVSNYYSEYIIYNEVVVHAVQSVMYIFTVWYLYILYQFERDDLMSKDITLDCELYYLPCQQL